MSAAVSTPEVITELTALVQAGDIPAAKKLGRTLINVADTRELWLIDRIAKLMENRPRTAVDVLRHWWATAPTEADRAIIAACAPKNGEQRHRPQTTTDRAPRWSRRNRYQAPSTVKVEHSDELRRRRRTRQEQSDAAAFNAYQAERAGVAEGDQISDRDERAQAEQVYASGFDYDRAALYGTDVAFRCLSCSISRGRYDLDRARMANGRGDDGLCADCRADGRPGIPALPVGHSVADAVTARCTVILAEFGTVTARNLLRAEWRQATMPAVRAAIADYVAANLPTEASAAEQTAATRKRTARKAADTKPATRKRKPAAEAPAEQTAAEEPAEVRADQEPTNTRPATRKRKAAAKKPAADVTAQEPANARKAAEDPEEAHAIAAEFGHLHCVNCEKERTTRDLRDVTDVTADDGMCARCRAVA